MKISSIIGFLILLSEGLLGQHRCLTMLETQREMAFDTAYAGGLKKIENQLASLDHESTWLSRDEAPIITVPVVVHVLYRNESQNIPMDQIQAQIDVLNRDFAGLNADMDKVPSPFREVAGFTRIQFKLADQDPEGNFTNGVTRTLTTVENIGSQAVYHRPERGGVAPWPTPHYMNVWVCELEGNALGFAILPSAQMSERDGIVMSPRAFGVGGTTQQSPYNLGRTFVHEVGHYFGLRHLWGEDNESCSSTDYVSDTPVQLKENFGCKNFPVFSCSGEPNGDMFMNYMDYGNDSCMLFFTRGQVGLMYLILRTNRKTLFNSSGITGATNARLGTNSSLSVYPNPNNGSFFLDAGMEDIGNLEIYSSTGQLVYQNLHHERRIQLDLEGISSGLYFAKSASVIVKFSIR